MLIQQLRDLEGNGVVVRTVYPEVPPKVEYALTEEGLALRPALVATSVVGSVTEGKSFRQQTSPQPILILMSLES